MSAPDLHDAVRAILGADGDDDPGALAAAELLAEEACRKDEARRGRALRTLFCEVVEPLNDSFRSTDRDRYARYFGRVVWRVVADDDELAPALAAHGIRSEADLLARHRRVRTDRCRGAAKPRTLAVLSRVTLGADVLLTAPLCAHLRRAWPDARIVLIGDPKLEGLIGGTPGLEILPLRYARRGDLRERLRAWLDLREAVAGLEPDLVVAPDSRFDQLGMLPLLDEDRYLLWENCQVEGEEPRGLLDLLEDWCRRRLPLPEKAPVELPRCAFDAATAALRDGLRDAFGDRPLAAIKLDHGGNPAKALPRDAEVAVLRGLRERGWRILLDRGFGDAELAASDELLAACGYPARDLAEDGILGEMVADLAPGSCAEDEVLRFHGSIAGWAAACSGCGLAFSYDSVGHHLAAACGVPLVSAFTGHRDPVFPIAWHPRGEGPVTQVVIPTDEKNDPRHLERLLAALPEAG